jgi:hypothetical protein
MKEINSKNFNEVISEIDLQIIHLKYNTLD